jgi:UDP-N-acetylglucosamine--N-acetylmuramyl-(pentapeptide) pyrophosphoryl-undecaprenol N-acetylglucosamine transferase
VPSPNVTNHHQEKNANVLGDHGAALVLAQEGLDGKRLFAAASEILHDEARRADMEKNMASLGVRDATERIYETVMSLAR